MTARTSSGTQVIALMASDLLVKFLILLGASFLFGFSFIVFRWKMPSASKRFLHIVINAVSVMLVVMSLENSSTLDMQDRVFGYFAFFLLFLAIYGISMLVSHIYRKKNIQQK